MGCVQSAPAAEGSQEIVAKGAEEEGGKFDEYLAEAAEVRENNPNNLCARFLTPELFYSYSPEEQEVLYQITRTGVENPSSGTGCYAMKPDDYQTFAKFFDQVIKAYHKPAAKNPVHVTDWDASDVGNNGVLDMTELGLDELSMRVRVGRNLTSFNLPGLMTREERVEFEKTMLPAFDKLISMEEYGGRVYSLTPEFGPGEPNPNKISDAEYKKLVDEHIMFKDMDADPYLKSAGISSDWPYGRGCYVSEDRQFIIWFGEEDHLRIMCMKKGTKLNEVFDRLREALSVVESLPGIEFATSKKYGYVTSCPTNLGTGMRASVHIKLPNLTADGTDTKAKAVAKPLGLSVRGIGGEHTPIGKDGTVDISPSARLFIKEKEIIAALYNGIEALMKEEQAAAEA
ncbi:Creatine kinase B-type [Hondaea fermentalgiana]|uniref:Creatine kinase B-type n=1 Tax=Hondaea fermentalgiana TaxID=2315210 RepID=A0A2R5G042_9STRA|nr:Creatine kinase B-type [Hondaea fermentalgiana]|eukprot:GBG24396.1 Creatine kinase B-type [Hondaea fermentalgiana]